MHAPDAATIETALRLLRGGPAPGDGHLLADHAAPGLPAPIRERLPAAQAHAEGAAAAIAARMAPRMTEFRARLAAVQSRSIGRTRAVIMLRALAADHAGIVAPHAACRVGCTHCCHIPVSMTATEAQIIGRATGRRPAPLPDDPPVIRAGYDNPCPFLDRVRNACSIHEHRPLACRLHFNLDADALLCELQLDASGNPLSVPVPLGDTRAFMAAYVARMGKSGGRDAVGDIRHFFDAQKMGTAGPSAA